MGIAILSLLRTLVTIAFRLERIPATLEALSVVVLPTIGLVRVNTATFSIETPLNPPISVALLKLFIDLVKVLLW